MSRLRFKAETSDGREKDVELEGDELRVTVGDRTELVLSSPTIGELLKRFHATGRARPPVVPSDRAVSHGRSEERSR